MLLAALLYAQAATPAPTVDSLVGFGVAAPIVAVMGWLLFRSTQREAELSTQVVALVERSAVTATETTAALDRSTTAIRDLTVEVRRIGERPA
jgi:uncharacterized protein YceH (UPF0502 family)